MIVANASTAMLTVEQGRNITLNVTEYSDGHFAYFTVCLQIIYFLILLCCLCGLAGNLKVIWILGFCIERNPFSTYVLNWAVADFGTLLSELAYDINMALVYFSNTFHGGFEIIFLLADVLDFFMYSASLYLLTAISLESGLALLFPIWYRCRRPERSSVVVSFLLWFLSSLFSGILLLCHLRGAYCRVIVNINCIVGFLVCTPLVIASSLIVMTTICCTSRRHQPPKLCVAILTNNLVFILFGLPLSLLHLFSANTDHFPLEALESSYLLASVNSGIKPLVFYLVGRDRKHPSRESLKAVLHRLFKGEADAGAELGKVNGQGSIRQRSQAEIIQ